MIEPVTDQESHLRALRRIEELWNAEPGSAEESELDALATLVDAYERRRFPILPLDPVAAIKARCEQLGWTRKDLEPLIGSRARVSEVLGGKRALTLPMIRKVHASMQIPADVLIMIPSKRRKGTKRAA
ncbi:helix-turn-helix domain-containing protein [Sorangium sp. So ce861]|uniref:helix-turn-helix domain-containing protein n=1 Tax=Sorangium sp. So ce861 TaxID=3133323 RepID=UPI003F618A01